MASVSKIGNNPKNGLSRARVGGVERSAEASPPPGLIPTFRPYFGPLQPVAKPLVRNAD